MKKQISNKLFTWKYFLNLTKKEKRIFRKCKQKRKRNLRSLNPPRAQKEFHGNNLLHAYIPKYMLKQKQTNFSAKILSKTCVNIQQNLLFSLVVTCITLFSGIHLSDKKSVP